MLYDVLCQDYPKPMVDHDEVSVKNRKENTTLNLEYCILYSNNWHKFNLILSK